jgi:hypothetical protein
MGLFPLVCEIPALMGKVSSTTSIAQAGGVFKNEVRV